MSDNGWKAVLKTEFVEFLRRYPLEQSFWELSADSIHCKICGEGPFSTWHAMDHMNSKLHKTRRDARADSFLSPELAHPAPNASLALSVASVEPATSQSVHIQQVDPPSKGGKDKQRDDDRQ